MYVFVRSVRVIYSSIFFNKIHVFLIFTVQYIFWSISTVRLPIFQFPFFPNFFTRLDTNWIITSFPSKNIWFLCVSYFVNFNMRINYIVLMLCEKRHKQAFISFAFPIKTFNYVCTILRIKLVCFSRFIFGTKWIIKKYKWMCRFVLPLGNSINYHQ